MKEVLEYIMVFSATFFQHIRAVYAELRHPEIKKIFSVYENLINNWVSALVSIAVVGYIALNQPEGINAIGISATEKPLNFAGMVKGFVFMAFLLILGYFYQRFWSGKKKPNEILVQDTLRPEVREILAFEHGFDRFVFLSVMTLRVLGEEFIYRGYLILFLGTRFGGVIPWLFLSILLSTAAHLYQERKISSVMVIILFSSAMGLFVVATQSLFASIAAHLFNNLAFTINIWRRADSEIYSNRQGESTKGRKFLKLMFGLLNFALVIGFLVWAFDLRFWIS